MKKTRSKKSRDTVLESLVLRIYKLSDRQHRVVWFSHPKPKQWWDNAVLFSYEWDNRGNRVSLGKFLIWTQNLDKTKESSVRVDSWFVGTDVQYFDVDSPLIKETTTKTLYLWDFREKMYFHRSVSTVSLIIISPFSDFQHQRKVFLPFSETKFRELWKKTKDFFYHFLSRWFTTGVNDTIGHEWQTLLNCLRPRLNIL